MSPVGAVDLLAAAFAVGHLVDSRSGYVVVSHDAGTASTEVDEDGNDPPEWDDQHKLYRDRHGDLLGDDARTVAPA
jgi:hypothetical protein